MTSAVTGQWAQDWISPINCPLNDLESRATGAAPVPTLRRAEQ
jgi:hypothetical protein